MMCQYEGSFCCPSSNTGTDAASTGSPCGNCQKGIMVLVSIIGGIVFAAAAGLLFVNGLLPEVATGIFVALISGLVLLTLLPFYQMVRSAKKALRCYFGGVMFGVLGTIFSAFLTVMLELDPASALSIAAVVLTAFFFAYMVISLLFLLRPVSEEA